MSQLHRPYFTFEETNAINTLNAEKEFAFKMIDKNHTVVDGAKSLRVVGLNGTAVNAFVNNSAGSMSADLSKLPNGVYIIITNNTKSIKISKQP